MPGGVYSLHSTLLKTLLHTNRPDVPVIVALRNTLAVVLPLVVGLATGHVLAGLSMSTGAIEAMFADQPGTYRQRFEAIGLVSLTAALSGLTGFLVAGSPALALVGIAAWGFVGGMLVLFGPHTTRVGVSSMILFIVATATPLPWQQAAGVSALILAGGMLQAALSVAAWPLGRYRPERTALAAVYRELAKLVHMPPRQDDAPPLTAALTQLQQTLLGHAHARGRAMQAFYALMELADRIRLGLVAGDALDLAARKATTRVLLGVARALERAKPPHAALQALERMKSELAPRPSPHVRALVGQLEAAIRNTRWAGSRGELQARHADMHLPRALRNAAPFAALRANLVLSSVAFRHALRCSVVLVIAMATAQQTHLGHGYWVPMTAAIVLRPDFGATLNVGFLRALGTVVGLVLTTILLHLAPNALWSQLALMTILCFAFRYLVGVHYGLAIAVLTGMVVILLAFGGVAPDTAVDERVINTVFGCVLALLAYVLWPTWERYRALPALASMLDAYGEYLATLDGACDAARRRDARAAARVARSNAQASLDRLRSEPATTEALLVLANTLLANGNRLIRSAMALEAIAEEDGRLPRAEDLAEFLGAATNSLHIVATALRERRRPPPLPVLRAVQQRLVPRLNAHADADTAATLVALTDRLTDNIDTLVYVIDNAGRPLQTVPHGSPRWPRRPT